MSLWGKMMVLLQVELLQLRVQLYKVIQLHLHTKLELEIIFDSGGEDYLITAIASNTITDHGYCW